ncbi:MAG TPA: asparagine synthase (glutamine-hydrolyzing), partial [Azospirillaceae bacterium]|nr:asparagine synthase (glutamine-hydrolyzing) [Azospirillaceae bacterium]
SDTEVLLEACAAWGMEAAIARCEGMFAFALWDRQARQLRLVRDRIGIKPLYWGLQGGTLVFGSTPRCFAHHPRWRAEIDREAVAACLRYSYIPAPLSIWRDVRKLEPGRILTVDAGGQPRETRYWNLAEIAAGAPAPPAGDAEAADRLEELLRDAVASHLVADVPVGAFLSGGIDSTLMVALMQARSARPVKTFTIGFDQGDADESGHARAVAAHLRTDHAELHLRDGDLPDLLPGVVEGFDEPFADASMIPTLLVSRLARGSVKVCLSGDGGDELFAGYTRYRLAANLHRTLRLLPAGLRRGLAAAMTSLGPGTWDLLAAALPASARPAFVGDRVHKLAAVLDFSGPMDLYQRLMSSWVDPGQAVPGTRRPAGTIWSDPPGAGSFVSRMQLVDTLTYLPDGILVKLDRASVAVGLEGRVPILDHRLVAFAAGLPDRLKRREGRSKWLLRQVLYRYVPPALVERPKMGFAPPTGAWLRGPLRDWAEDLLDVRSLAQGGLFDPAPVRRRFEDHLCGRRNWQFSLWEVLMVEAWRRRWAA